MNQYSDRELKMILIQLNDTHCAIQSLSKWCIKQHKHYKSIITIWSKVIRKVKIEKRLTLFYLANDVIQRSKGKNDKFIDEWATAIQNAIPYVLDKKIHSKISRIINIWEDRDVFDKSYLANLTALLNTPIQKLTLDGPEQKFQVHVLAAKIHACTKLKKTADLELKYLEEFNLSLINNEAMQNMLKDKKQSLEFLKQLNDDTFKIKTQLRYMHREISDRYTLQDALQAAVSYYKELNGEFEYVAQAYFDYAKTLKLVQSKLISLIGSMPTDSPITSPDINAPSPSTSFESIEELNLHGTNYYDTMLNSDKYMKNSSMENSINDTNFDVPTTIINNINSYVTPDTYTTVQDLHDSVPVSFPEIEYHDQQSLTSQFPYDAPSPPPYDAPSPPPDETFAYLAFPNQFDHYAIAPNIIDRDEQVYKEMISYTSDVNHKNLISLTHHPEMNSSMISVDVDNQALSGNPMPPSAPAMFLETTGSFYKPPEENLESVDMDMSDDEEPKSNHDQKHAALLPPPPLPPQPLMSLDFNQQQSVQVVTKQWQPPLQPWSKDTPSFNERQWNVHQSDQWKHLNQWEHAQCDSNFIQNQHQLQQPQFQQLQFQQPQFQQPQFQQSQFQQPQFQHPQHVQRHQSQEDFRPKWKNGTSYWPRGSRNFVPHSRPAGRWNQGPHFGPRNQPW